MDAVRVRPSNITMVGCINRDGFAPHADAGISINANRQENSTGLMIRAIFLLLVFNRKQRVSEMLLGYNISVIQQFKTFI